MTETLNAYGGPWTSPRQETGETIRIDYVPRPGLLKLCLVNTLLWLLTLTIYRFWAKTNVRRHIWSSVHINGEPLEYTGRGSELFLGAVIVFGVLILPSLLLLSAIAFFYGADHPAYFIIQVLIFISASLLWGAAVYRSRRYQLSRTLWRGIRGTLAGSAGGFSLVYFGASILRAITLGWTTPLMNVSLQKRMMGNTHFGDTAFSFKGRAGALYPSFAMCWFLNLAMLVAVLATGIWTASAVYGDSLEALFFDLAMSTGTPSETATTALGVAVIVVILLFLMFSILYPMVWALYTARELAAFAGFTRFGSAAFSMNATAGSLIRLAIGNLLLTIFTLGIAAPYVQQRLVRYLCERLRVEGRVDIDRIRQSTMPLDRTGEGLADALDIGGI